MPSYKRIPVRPTTRVIVDNDHAGDPDGLVSLAHQLLTESTEVTAVLGTSIPTRPDAHVEAGSAQRAADELLDRLAPAHRPPTYLDASVRLQGLGHVPPGAHAIIDEALRADDRPLVVTCGGPLTNIAAALKAEPSIADRMTVAWIGGNGHPDGGWEYNLSVDVPAAQVVFNESTVPVWQFPQPTYRQCLWSIAEMEWELTSAGEFGAWLYERFTSPPDFVQLQGIWPMGDSPVVMATGLGSESSLIRTIDRPWIGDDMTYQEHPGGGKITLYETVDFRLIIADFVARLRLADRHRE